MLPAHVLGTNFCKNWLYDCIEYWKYLTPQFVQQRKHFLKYIILLHQALRASNIDLENSSEAQAESSDGWMWVKKQLWQDEGTKSHELLRSVTVLLLFSVMYNRSITSFITNRTSFAHIPQYIKCILYFTHICFTIVVWSSFKFLTVWTMLYQSKILISGLLSLWIT